MTCHQDLRKLSESMIQTTLIFVHQSFFFGAGGLQRMKQDDLIHVMYLLLDFQLECYAARIRKQFSKMKPILQGAEQSFLRINNASATVLVDFMDVAKAKFGFLEAVQRHSSLQTLCERNIGSWTTAIKKQRYQRPFEAWQELEACQKTISDADATWEQENVERIARRDQAVAVERHYHNTVATLNESLQNLQQKAQELEVARNDARLEQSRLEGRMDAIETPAPLEPQASPVQERLQKEYNQLQVKIVGLDQEIQETRQSIDANAGPLRDENERLRHARLEELGFHQHHQQHHHQVNP